MPAHALVPHFVFHLSVLGPAVLAGAKGLVFTLRTRKQLGVLFYLTRRARPVARDELIDLFWSEDSEKRARHSLSQSCSLINKVLGDEVIVTAGRDRLSVREGAIGLDVHDFERLVAAGDHAGAIALWRGVLFEGLWVQRAPNFERWLTDEREKLQRLFRRLVHTRIESLRHAGDHPAMRDEADRLLQHDPLDEKAMLAYLEALTLLGDRSLALRRYGEFESRLHRELEAEPGAALRAWAKRSRKSDGGAAPGDRLPAPRISEITVLPAVQPFFGRTEEFAMLWKAWETAGTGKGSFIIIEGEAGIGKTALATKLVNQAHVAGGSVCFVKCYRTEKSVPFAPITALIRQLSRLPGFVALDPVWIGELTRLVPELRERYPNVPQPMAVDDAARHRLSDAAVSAALSVADEDPLMIIVDDLLDSDDASLALLHYLGRQTPGQPILFLGISRSGSASAEYETLFLETAKSAGFARSFALGSLNDDSIGRLAHQILAKRGLEATDKAVHEVVHMSGGNPLHAIEAALSAGSNEGMRRIDPADSEDAFGKSASDRFAQLSSQARLVASTIVIAGRPLAEYELAGITDLNTADLALATEALEGSQFVRRFGPSVALLHERYSAVVGSQITQDQRKALHFRIAELCKNTAAKNPAAEFETAKHYAIAGETGEAIAHALLASQHANSIGAVRSKAEALELVLQLSKDFDLRASADLAESYLNLGDITSLDSLCARLKASARIPSSFRGAMTYLETAASIKVGRSNMAEAEATLRNLIDGGTNFVFRNDARVLLIQVADKTGSFDLARQTARILRADSKDDLSAHALLATGYVFAKYYWPQVALPLLERAVERLQSLGSLALEQLARDCVGIVLKMIGRFHESIEHFDRSLALARKTMDPHGEARCLQNRAVSEIVLGSFDRARETLFEAERLRVSEWAFGLYTGYNVGVIDLLEGNLPEACYNLENCLRGAVNACNLLLAGDCCAGIAIAKQRMGQNVDLASFVRKMKDLDPNEVSTRVGWIRHAADAWNTAINLGNPEAALSLLEVQSRQLRRRDTASWLTLELEVVRLMERYEGRGSASERRERLVENARRFDAGFVNKAAHGQLSGC